MSVASDVVDSPAAMPAEGRKIIFAPWQWSILLVVLAVGVVALIVTGSKALPTVDSYYSKVVMPADIHRLSGSRYLGAQSLQSPGQPEMWQYTYSHDQSNHQTLNEFTDAVKAAGFVVDHRSRLSVHAGNGRINIGATISGDNLSVMAVEVK